jgi:hypothetical protein
MAIAIVLVILAAIPVYVLAWRNFSKRYASRASVLARAEEQHQDVLDGRWVHGMHGDYPPHQDFLDATTRLWEVAPEPRSELGRIRAMIAAREAREAWNARPGRGDRLPAQVLSPGSLRTKTLSLPQDEDLVTTHFRAALLGYRTTKHGPRRS